MSRKGKIEAVVCYDGGWPCGVFRTVSAAAAHFGVTEKTIGFLASPAAHRRRPNGRLVEIVRGARP